MHSLREHLVTHGPQFSHPPGPHLLPAGFLETSEFGDAIPMKLLSLLSPWRLGRCHLEMLHPRVQSPKMHAEASAGYLATASTSADVHLFT